MKAKPSSFQVIGWLTQLQRRAQISRNKNYSGPGAKNIYDNFDTVQTMIFEPSFDFVASNVT